MDGSNPPDSRSDPKNDDLTKSLTAEFSASTWTPIGSSSRFDDSFDAPLASKPRRSVKEHSEARRDLLWLLHICLITITVDVVAAATLFLMA